MADRLYHKLLMAPGRFLLSSAPGVSHQECRGGVLGSRSESLGMQRIEGDKQIIRDPGSGAGGKAYISCGGGADLEAGPDFLEFGQEALF